MVDLLQIFTSVNTFRDVHHLQAGAGSGCIEMNKQDVSTQRKSKKFSL